MLAVQSAQRLAVLLIGDEHSSSGSMLKKSKVALLAGAAGGRVVASLAAWARMGCGLVDHPGIADTEGAKHAAKQEPEGAGAAVIATAARSRRVGGSLWSSWPLALFDHI